RADHILLAGSSSSDGGLNVVVFKYNADGTRLWSTNFGGPSYKNYFTRALALDGTDQILVVSSIEDDDDDELGTAIIKIDSEGRRLWNAIEPDLEVTDATRMTTDAYGNTYVTGRSYLPATGDDVTTVKFDPEGNRLWRAHYAAAGLSAETGTAVALDPHGDVRVAGYATAFTG